MTKPQSRRAGWTLLAVILLFMTWYVIATGYDYADLAGRYTLTTGTKTTILILNKDRTFHQEIRTDGYERTADGSWRRIGEGGVNFSKEFLPIPGAKTYAEEFPDHLYGIPEDHQYYGHFERVMGIFPVLNMNATPPGVSLRRTVF